MLSHSRFFAKSLKANIESYQVYEIGRNDTGRQLSLHSNDPFLKSNALQVSIEVIPKYFFDFRASCNQSALAFLQFSPTSRNTSSCISYLFSAAEISNHCNPFFSSQAAKLTDYLDVRFSEAEAISSSLNLSVFAAGSRKSYLF